MCNCEQTPGPRSNLLGRQDPGWFARGCLGNDVRGSCTLPGGDRLAAGSSVAEGACAGRGDLPELALSPALPGKLMHKLRHRLLLSLLVHLGCGPALVDGAPSPQLCRVQIDHPYIFDFRNGNLYTDCLPLGGCLYEYDPFVRLPAFLSVKILFLNGCEAYGFTPEPITSIDQCHQESFGFDLFCDLR
jgi:hypothetical protein